MTKPSFSTHDLSEWMNALCVALEARGLAVVEPAHDHYWSLEPSSAFDLSREPPVTVGQVSDDTHDLRFEIQLTRDPDTLNHVSDWHFARHLFGVINYLSFITGSGKTVASQAAKQGGA